MEATAEKKKLAEDTETLKRIAKNIKREGEVQAAAQLEAQIIALEPNNPSSFINLSESLVKLGHPEDALTVLLDGEDLNPESEEIKFALAKRLIENNKPEAALVKLSEIKESDDRDYYNALGVANDMVGEFESAQTAYKQGLEIKPNDGMLLNNMALSYVLNKDYKKGIDILEKLVARPRYNLKYRQNLALAYGLNKQDSKAKRMLMKDMPRELAEENIEYYKEIRK